MRPRADTTSHSGKKRSAAFGRDLTRVLKKVSDRQWRSGRVSDGLEELVVTGAHGSLRGEFTPALRPVALPYGEQGSYGELRRELIARSILRRGRLCSLV